MVECDWGKLYQLPADPEQVSIGTYSYHLTLEWTLTIVMSSAGPKAANAP